MWNFRHILRSGRLPQGSSLQLVTTSISTSQKEFSHFTLAAAVASAGLVATTFDLSDSNSVASSLCGVGEGEGLDQNLKGTMFCKRFVSCCEAGGKSKQESKSSQKDDDDSDNGSDSSSGDENDSRKDKADPSFHENSAAITFRRRRLSLNAAKDIQPVTQQNDETESSQSSRKFNGQRRRYPKHRIMYSSEFETESDNDNNKSINRRSLPFPPHQVGTYSCHGVEPHPFIVYTDDTDQGLDSHTQSFFQKLFGSSSNVDHDDDDESTHTRRHRPARVVTISKSKINQDRGHVIYPYVNNDTGNTNSKKKWRNVRSTSNSLQQTALFGAYDGHGERGELLAEYTMKALSDKLHLHPSFPRDHEQSGANIDVGTAFRDVFLQIDDEIQHEERLRPMHSGSTACVAFLQGKKLWVANVGDSRAVLGRRRSSKNNKTTYDAIDLTKDQNAYDETERDRIIKAGGFVTIPEDTGFAARIWADEACTQVGLAMSRSIGDHALKHVGVTADPVVERYDLADGDEFLVIATDGVWEFISSEGAVDIIQRCFNEGMGASEASAYLIKVAMNKWKEKEGDYRDDITAIVVKLDGIWGNEN